MCQLPPDSHCASASQLSPLLGTDGFGGTLVPTLMIRGCAGVTTWVCCTVRPAILPLTYTSRYVTRCTPALPGLATTSVPLTAVGSGLRTTGGGTGVVLVTVW